MQTVHIYAFPLPALLCVLCCAPAAFRIYRRSVHMFQLCSYQDPSYKKYLRENTAESFSVRRLLPLGLTAAFGLHLEIAPVYFLLSLEECVRLLITIFVFRQKSWMQELS